MKKIWLAVLTALALSAPASAEMERDHVRRMLDVGNFPLIPAVGSAFGWSLGTALWEGARGFAGTAAIGAPAAIGMALLAQSAMGIEMDVPKAIASGLGSTLLPLALAGMTGPAAPLVYFGVSMAGSYLAQYLIDLARERRDPFRGTAAARGPAERLASPHRLSLLGVVGN